MFQLNIARTLLVFSILVLIPLHFYAQKAPIKFGKVSKEELEMKVYEKDTAAEAVVLAEYGASEIRYVSSDKGFVLVFENHTRIKILKKEGLDYANVDVRLYSARANVDEDVSGLKAQTYNLENGKIVTTKLSRKEVFEEDESKHWKLKKFALPNVKVGSVIEYKYIVTSEFFYIKPWYFQTTIPVVWSEYRTTIPEYFKFKRFFGRYMSPDISESSNFSGTFPGGGTYVTDRNRYVFKDVPAFRSEDYITTADDYLAKVEFEHLSTIVPGAVYETYNTSWNEICHKLLVRDDFGNALNRKGIVKDLVETINISDPVEKKVAAAYYAIKKKMKWNNEKGILAENTLKSAYNDNKGNVAEINLLLVNLLRAVGIQSHPVLLSTRSHGKVNNFYAKRSSFNYVVTLAIVDGKNVLLDASRDFLEPGTLSYDCLNGQGLIATEGKANWINLRSSETFTESTSVMMNIDEEGLNATMYRRTNGLSARRLRYQIAKDGKEKYVENYIENQEDWEIEDIIIENEKDVSKPVVEKIKITEFNNIDLESDMIYLPAIIVDEEENPFTSESRKYPVDFAVPIRSKYILNFTLPEGYMVDEMPESSSVTLPDKAATFIYKIQKQNGILQIYCQTKINKTLFLPEEYKLLREFYTHITEKLNEQIVLKKI
ncbi:MAG: DUF3857 domain-containing protein [Bacteroidota bacterium]